MIVFRKAVLPSSTEVEREMRLFAGTIPQRSLHNRLVDQLNSAREKLQNATNLDEMCREQGSIKAIEAALLVLHEETTPALKEQLYV